MNLLNPLNTKPADVHWNYFLSLESDLIDLSRYVEFHPDNYKTYSIEIARLFLTAAAETEVVCKHLSYKLDPVKTPAKGGNMGNYRDVITSKKPNFARFEVKMPRYNITLKPWESWQVSNNAPIWWDDYTDVKHQRHQNYPKAKLENLLNAMAALFVAWLHYLEDQSNPKYTVLDPDSAVFHLPRDKMERWMYSVTGLHYDLSEPL